MIAGIILAAGQSARMGRPKASLRVGELTFLEAAVQVLRDGGCDEIVTVLDPTQALAAEEPEESGYQPAWGSGPGTEQIDSLRAGLRALPSGAEAAVVLPVDHPKVQTRTVTSLIAAFRASGAPIVLPVYEGAHGHPVLFSAMVFDELLHGRLREGARTVVHGHREELEEVEVDDEGIILDVDTPRDYQDHLGE